MADALDALTVRFEDALRRAFDRDESLQQVEITLAERIGEEAARMAIASIRWRQAAGHSLTTSDLVKRWRVSRQAIAKRVKNGTLIGLPGRSTTYFPAWQFDSATGEVRPIVAHILKIFEYYCGRIDPRVVASWAATPQPELRGLQPRTWIESNRDEEQIIQVAAASAREFSK